MWETLIIAVFSLLQAVLVAIVTSERKRRKAESKKSERRAARRAEESLLSMKLINANTELTFATAVAVEKGHTNGEMKKACENVESAQNEYFGFINRIATEKISEE
ncbi:MAG: hypothetical protein FWH20_00580 [Oscillospiraceae bacterium]|nr:hypothetical protein [Oscillospiraceae bacterium]